MAFIGIFSWIVGFTCLYLGFKRDAILWYIIAAIIFLVTSLYGMTIPFNVDSSGQVIGTSANYMITGLSLIFFVISFLFALKYAFYILK